MIELPVKKLGGLAIWGDLDECLVENSVESVEMWKTLWKTCG